VVSGTGNQAVVRFLKVKSDKCTGKFSYQPKTKFPKARNERQGGKYAVESASS